MPLACRFLCHLCVSRVLGSEWAQSTKHAVMRKTACCRCVDFCASSVPFTVPFCGYNVVDAGVWKSDKAQYHAANCWLAFGCLQLLGFASVCFEVLANAWLSLVLLGLLGFFGFFWVLLMGTKVFSLCHFGTRVMPKWHKIH